MLILRYMLDNNQSGLSALSQLIDRFTMLLMGIVQYQKNRFSDHWDPQIG
jgi:hypothetical protein